MDIDSSNSSSESSESFFTSESSSFEEEVVRIRRPVIRRPRTFNIRPDYFDRYDDFDFVRRFRLNKEAVTYLMTHIEDNIKPNTMRFVKIQIFQVLWK